MNYPYSIGVVKAHFSYVGRHIEGFFGQIVDNFYALWMAPGKCRTNPEIVGLNPENVGIERLSKTVGRRTSTGFAVCPRARARKQKKQETRNRARKPARGTLRVPPASRLPLPLSSPRLRGRQVPQNRQRSTTCAAGAATRITHSTTEKSSLQKTRQTNRRHSERAAAGFEPPQEAKSGP